MKILLCTVVVLVVLAALVLGFLMLGSFWKAVAKEDTGVFSSEHDAAYTGSTAIHTAPAIAAVKQGEPVVVLWDTYGKDYWPCYVRTATGQRGWLLCPSLQRTTERYAPSRGAVAQQAVPAVGRK